MDIDALVESFYSSSETEDLINEVMKLLLVETQSRKIALSWDGIPDIPISEIPWSDVKTVEGEGADIDGPQRQQLMQFLDDIQGDDLKDKIDGIAKFYDADVSQLTAAAEGLSPKKQISYALGYLTFFKTLTKIIAHFNASSAGFSFEAFLGVLLGGKQIPASGADTIADLVDQKGVPISLKLYTAGQLKVGGSFTDLANDLRKYGQMQYVAVTKTLNDEKTSGTLDFYRFNFTLENIANILVNAGLHNPEVMQLPAAFVSNPAGFEDIEIPAPPKMEELVKIYEDRVKELGRKYPEEVLINAIAAVGLPEDTSMLKGQKKIFGRDELPKIRSPKVSTSGNIKLALRMGLLPEEPPPFPTSTSKKPEAVAAREEWMETYGKRIGLALDVYNNVVATAYNDVVEATKRNIAARQELISRAGGEYLSPEESAAAYNELSDGLKKKALLLTHGYVNTDQFDLTEPRVLGIQKLASGKAIGDADEKTEQAPITEAQGAGSVGIFPAGQEQVKLGSIEVGQEKVVALLEKVSEIIDTSVFEIFEELKRLTTNIQAYFGNNLEDDKLATAAIDASESIGTKTAALADDEE
tara:strand:+ start:3185 stop:4936 length:1752 start_codon:yes stop_codon:yes gene_type:complete